MKTQRKSIKSKETTTIGAAFGRAPQGRGAPLWLWLLFPLILLIFFVFSWDFANLCIRRYALLWIISLPSTIIKSSWVPEGWLPRMAYLMWRAVLPHWMPHSETLQPGCMTSRLAGCWPANLFSFVTTKHNCATPLFFCVMCIFPLVVCCVCCRHLCVVFYNIFCAF